MKKKLLIASLLAFALAAPMASAEKTVEEKDLALQSLGIVSAELSDSKIVTTEEYLSAVVNMMTDSQIPVASGYSYAKNIGIGGGISEFKLQNSLSKEYALKIALRALGYDTVIKKSGDSEDILSTLGSDTGLTKGVDMANLNGENVIKLLYNLSKTGMMQMNLGGEGGYELDGNEETILKHYRGITNVEGVVTATYNTSLIKETGVAAKQIEINNEKYTVKDTYSTELLGMPIKAYLAKDGETILYVAADSDDVDTFELKADTIDNVDTHFEYIGYTEEETEKQKKVKLSPTVKVIYNGRFYAGYTTADLMPDNGKLVFTDTDKDGKYDIVFVYSYQTMVAETVSGIKNTITNKFNYTGEKSALPTLEIKDDDVVKVYASDGTSMKLSSVKTGNVLSIAFSKGANERLITIYVSTEKLSGTVTSINNEDKILEMDGEEYGIAQVYYDALAGNDTKMTEIKIGNATVLYLDNEGKVAYADNDRLGGFAYLYVLRVRPFGDEKYGVRGLNLDGEWKDLYFAEKVKLYNVPDVNGSLAAENAYTALSAQMGGPDLVMVKYNKDGEIKELKVAKDTNATDTSNFTKTTQATRCYYNFEGASVPNFGFKDYATTDTVVFRTPSDSTQRYVEKEYSVGSLELLKHWNNCTYSSYNKDENNVAAVLVCVNQNAASDAWFMINSVDRTVNEDDQGVKRFKGEVTDIGGVSVKEYEPNIITENFVNGDIVTFTLKDGLIKAATKIYGLSDGVQYKTPSGDFAGSVSVKGVVTAVDIDNRLVTIDCSGSGDTYTFNSHTNQAYYTMYNRETSKYEKATLNEIEKGDFVMLNTYSCTIRSGVIIKPAV